MSERYTHLDSIKVDGIASTSQQGALIGASKVMPQPSADLDGVTIQYMGPTDSNYTFKRMYTCTNVGLEYKWVDATPVDIVQNSNGLFIGGNEIEVADSSKYGVMSPDQAEKVESSFVKLETVTEGAEPNKVDIIRVEGTPLQVSGSDKSVNITRTSLGLGDSAQLDVGTLEGQIPVLGANGLLPDSTIPPFATGTFINSVRTKALLTSLSTAKLGDWAKVTSDDDFNNNGSYILNGTEYGVLSNWVQMVGPANVESVNGKSGRVVLDKEDIGLANVDNTSDAKKPISEAMQSALNDCVKLSGSDTAQVILNGGLQLPNGDLSIGGGALIGKDTQPALFRVRGNIEATLGISGPLIQTASLDASDKSTNVASTAWVATATSVVHTTGNENIAGVKTFTGQIKNVNSYPNIIIQETSGEVATTTGEGRILFYDKSSNLTSQLGSKIVSVDGMMSSKTEILSASKKSDGSVVVAGIGAYAFPDGTGYGLCIPVSNKSDNSNKIVTTNWANSATTLVHTTGNEMISGNKTFTNVPYISKEAPILVIKSTNENKTDPSNNANAECGIYISGSDGNNFGKFYSTLDSENTAITRMMAWSSYKASLEVINKADGTSYSTAPATKDTHPDDAIVTKKYLLDKISALEARIATLEAKP